MIFSHSSRFRLGCTAFITVYIVACVVFPLSLLAERALYRLIRQAELRNQYECQKKVTKIDPITDTVQWKDVGHEMILHGRSFDVVSRSYENGHEVFMVVADEAEDNLDERISRMLDENDGSERATRLVHATLLLTIGVVPQRYDEVQIDVRDVTRLRWVDTRVQLARWHGDVPTPPPWRLSLV